MEMIEGVDDTNAQTAIISRSQGSPPVIEFIRSSSTMPLPFKADWPEQSMMVASPNSVDISNPPNDHGKTCSAKRPSNLLQNCQPNTASPSLMRDRIA
jgi:hypothetical protein